MGGFCESMKEYNDWVAAIAEDVKGERCVGILQHIVKHSTVDLNKHVQEREPDWRRWSASMHNLLAIFDSVYLGGVPPSIEEQLLRLQDHYVRNPTRRTPFPRRGTEEVDPNHPWRNKVGENRYKGSCGCEFDGGGNRVYWCGDHY